MLSYDPSLLSQYQETTSKSSQRSSQVNTTSPSTNAVGISLANLIDAYDATTDVLLIVFCNF